MPFLLAIPWYWVTGSAAAGVATAMMLDEAETVINLPPMSDEQVKDFAKISKQASIGDGIASVGEGLAIIAVLVAVTVIAGKLIK